MNSLLKEVPDNPARQPLKVRLVLVATQLLTEPRAARLPTMREIASQAGVTPGAAYRHFASQGDLFMAVIAHLFGELERALKISVVAAGPPDRALESIAVAYVEWGLQNAGGYQLLFETTDDPNHMATGARPGLHMIEQLARVFAHGLTPTDHDVSKATRLWVSLHGLVSLRTHKTGMPWPTTLDEDIVAIIRQVQESLPDSTN